ncbi:MAG TPA: hypothetical protein VFP72_17570 [Kineosporiaceae bacterium]|nr:hypothetical protein [Kineosporiaceae bacterium]
MTWWAWVLLWAAILLCAGVVLFLRGRSLWRKAMALVGELGLAADRLGELDRELATLSGRAAGSGDLAVFADPGQLRRQRFLTRSGRGEPAGRNRRRAAPATPDDPPVAGPKAPRR